MPKNIFLQVEYVGTRYFGFQVQNKKGVQELTIQECIESAIKKLFGRKMRIIYSSRTDRGVHAKAQSINFQVNTKIPAKNIKRALNTHLPQDIRIKTVKFVPASFHARFNAISKIYRYVILNREEPSVFWSDFAWHINKPLGITKMKRASRFLLGKKDFSLFAKKSSNYESCIRTIKNIVIRNKASFVYIDIEADGFLRNMARNIAAFLVKAGQGNLTLKDAGLIIKGKKQYKNEPAPACGLYLEKVNYE